MDDKQKTGSPDNDLINISEAYEVRDWADKFCVTHAKLKSAVNLVGNSAKKVEAYLKKIVNCFLLNRNLATHFQGLE